MRSGLDAATLALYQSGDFDLHERVHVANGSGTLIDLHGRLKGIGLKLPDPKEPIASLDVEFIRETTGTGIAGSLAPMVEGSDFNKLDDGITYSPLLQLGRTVTYEVALTAKGAARPADASSLWYEVFQGYITAVDWPQYGSRTASIQCNDLAGLLEIAKSEEAYTYTAGTSIETVAQEILTNNGFPGVTLYFPAATGKVLPNDYAPGLQKTVWSQLWALAQSMGWICYYRYRGHGDPELTFFEPERDKVAADMTTAAYDFRALSIDETEVRNVGRLVFYDAGGAQTVVGPLEDAASIARYGGIRRVFWINLEKDSPIRDSTSATEMLTAALSDVADPDAIATAETFPLVFAEAGVDLYTFPSDERFFDSDQTFAPFSVTLNSEAGTEPISFVNVRGTPTAGTKVWSDITTGNATLDLAEDLAELQEYIDGAFADNILSDAEVSAIDSHVRELDVIWSEVDARYTVLSNSLYLTGTAESNLETAYLAAEADYVDLLTAILAATIDLNDTTRSDLDTAFEDFGLTLGTLSTRMEEAQSAIEDARGDDLGFGAGIVMMETFRSVPPGMSTMTNVSAVEDALAAGGAVLRVDGRYRYWYPGMERAVVFDPTKLYQVQVKVRVAQDDSVDQQRLYAGVQLFDAAGVRIMAGLPSGNAYITASTQEPFAADGSVVYTGYLRGDGPYVGNANDPLNPSGTSVACAYIAPVILINYSAPTDQITEIEYFRIAVIDGEYADALKADTDADIADVSQAVTDLDTYVDNAFHDGIITETEAKVLGAHIRELEKEKADVDARYLQVYNHADLPSAEQSTLQSTKLIYNAEHASLITTIENAIADGEASSAEAAAVDAAFVDYGAALSTFSEAMQDALEAIENANIEASDKPTVGVLKQVQGSSALRTSFSVTIGGSKEAGHLYVWSAPESTASPDPDTASSPDAMIEVDDTGTLIRTVLPADSAALTDVLSNAREQKYVTVEFVTTSGVSSGKHAFPLRSYVEGIDKDTGLIDPDKKYHGFPNIITPRGMMNLGQQGGSITTNPSFADWPSDIALPRGFDAWNTVPDVETTITRSGGVAPRWTLASAVNAGMVASNSSTPNTALVHVDPDYVVIEADVRWESGTFNVAGVLLDWVSTAPATYRQTIKFVNELAAMGITAEHGKWYTVRKVLPRPSSFTGTFGYLRMYVMAAWSGHGTLAATDIIIDRVNVREASEQEIAAYLALETDGGVIRDRAVKNLPSIDSTTGLVDPDQELSGLTGITPRIVSNESTSKGQNLLGADAGPEMDAAAYYYYDGPLEDLGLEEGDVISASVDAQADAGTDSNARVNIRFRLGNEPGTIIETHTGGGGAVDGTGDWERATNKNVTVPAGCDTIEIYQAYSTAAGSLKFRRAMLNRGPVALPFEEPPFRIERETIDEIRGDLAANTGKKDSAGTILRIQKGYVEGVVAHGDTVTFPDEVQFTGAPIILWGPGGLTHDPRSVYGTDHTSLPGALAYDATLPTAELVQADGLTKSGFTARLVIYQQDGVLTTRSRNVLSFALSAIGDAEVATLNSASFGADAPSWNDEYFGGFRVDMSMAYDEAKHPDAWLEIDIGLEIDTDGAGAGGYTNIGQRTYRMDALEYGNGVTATWLSEELSGLIPDVVSTSTIRLVLKDIRYHGGVSPTVLVQERSGNEFWFETSSTATNYASKTPTGAKLHRFVAMEPGSVVAAGVS